MVTKYSILKCPGHERQGSDCWGGGIRGLNGNGKNTIKIFKNIK